MRPIRLEVKGFSTFRDQTEIDFTDVDLVAFVGPTGAGKSTIIDGIIFALYGSVVRYKASNLVAPVINQLSNEARIRLDFSVGGRTYTAVRVVRRTPKGATTKEARLETGEEVLAGNASELDAAIEALLGLTFEQFTKTVVLPQGEFARFLTETPEARQSLLRKLLGMELYRSMGSTARDRARTADTKSAALIEQQSDRPVVTAEVVAEAAAEAASLSALKEVIAEEVEASAAAELAAKEATQRDATADGHLQQLKALKVPAAAAKLEKAAVQLEQKRDVAREGAEAAATALGEATDAADEQPSITELERLIELHAELHEIDVQTTTSSALAELANTSLASAAAAELAAETKLGELEQHHRAAVLRAGASGLRDILVVGEPCPVCEQAVHDIPKHDVTAELAALETSMDTQRAETENARSGRRTAEHASAEANAEVTSLSARRDEVANVLADEPTLKEATRQLRSARTAETRLDKARSKAERALTKLQDVERLFSDLNTESAELRRDLTTTRDALASLGPPVPSEESIVEDWAELVGWGATVAAEVASTRKQATSDAKEAGDRVRHHRATITDLCAPYTDGTAPDDPVSWLAAEIGRSNAKVQSLEQEQEAQSKTAARIARLQSEASVAGELGRLLNARGFEQWLMSDVMHTLAERATERLIELSGGAYSLLTNGTDFSIRDHRNADEVRGARTLSGGETFLASLSLALALTDNIAALASEGAPAIESMFLDEGFGTLDTETLDVVASAIEELGAEGRMIGVVTHIRDLADRIPVRFDVARTPNGSTVTRTTID